MADKKISVLPDRPAVDGTEQIPVAYSGTTYKITVNKIKDFIVGLFANKATVLDKLGVSADNKLQFDGTDVQASATQASGASTEVQFRNATTGALDSDSAFVYDKTLHTLSAGATIRRYGTSRFINEAGNDTLTVAQAIENVGNGLKCLESITTGAYNTGDGYKALQNVTSGSYNTGAGDSAGVNISTGWGNTLLGALSGLEYTVQNNIIAIGKGVTKENKSSYDFICGISSYLLLEGNMAAGTRWFRVNAAQLIRAFEITSIAPVVTGTVTYGTSNTLTDSSKTYVLNQYANFVVEKTTVGGEKEQRVILSNTVAGELTVRDNWTVTPVAGDTFKIITATIITADNLGSIYRFNLSSGYDHALILPSVTDTFNRAFCEFYIEGHSGTAVLHKFPATGQLIQGQAKTEMVANREMVRLLSHAQSTYHWDVESTVGLEAYVSATAATQSVVAPNLTFTPITTAVTVLRSKRFQPVNVGGQVWMKYTSSLGRSIQVGVGAAVVNQSTPATVITVGVRIYKASTATTTDYTLVGSSEQLATTGQLRNFILADIFELESGDRLQVIHKASNNNNYNITASLQII